MIPVALTIAGSDSGGGAGIQADLKTFFALGVFGTSALTALTAQNTLGVSAVHAPPPDFVAAQIAAVLADFRVGAAKNRHALFRRDHPGRRSSAGCRPRSSARCRSRDDRDLRRSAHPAGCVAAMVETLFPRAALVTPNLAEAAALTRSVPATDLHVMHEQAKRSSQWGRKPC